MDGIGRKEISFRGRGLFHGIAAGGKLHACRPVVPGHQFPNFSAAFFLINGEHGSGQPPVFLVCVRFGDL